MAEEHGGEDAGESERQRRDREWAQAASAPRTPGVPAGGGTADPVPYRSPKHLRSGGGPRFSGRGVLAVFGILGLLLTVGLMALLAVRVLDATDPLQGLPGEDPGSGATDGPEPSTKELDPTPGAPLDAARAAECETERATVEVAVLAYEVTTGSPPPDLQALVDFGVLAGPVSELSHGIGADGQLVATGTCAG